MLNRHVSQVRRYKHTPLPFNLHFYNIMQKANRVSEDKDSFLQIVNKMAMIHKVIVYDYCLMDNHYNLLMETQTDNLVIFMWRLNSRGVRLESGSMSRVPSIELYCLLNVPPVLMIGIYYWLFL